MTDERRERIAAVLVEKFQPSRLQLKDQSHLHAGHAGARDGRGHFDLFIEAEAFSGRSQIERHRLVYAALDELMKTDIHALRIKAVTPGESTPASPD